MIEDAGEYVQALARKYQELEERYFNLQIRFEALVNDHVRALKEHAAKSERDTEVLKEIRELLKQCVGRTG